MKHDLFESAKKGDLETVRYLLENNFNDVDEDVLIELANTGLKALFEPRPKISETEAQNVKDAAKDLDNPTSDERKVTPKNANAVLRAIKNYPYAEKSSGVLQFHGECAKYYQLMNN